MKKLNLTKQLKIVNTKSTEAKLQNVNGVTLIALVITIIVLLILAGGIVYTLGTIFYGIGRTKKYMHSMFHLFEVLATLLQLLAIILYVV